MITLWRGNSYTELHGADNATLAKLGRNLAIQLKPDRKTKLGTRFGSFFHAYDALKEENTFWGSLLHGHRVAAGLTPHVMQLLTSYGVAFQYREMRKRPSDELPLWCLKFTPRPYQDSVSNQIIKYGVGVIDAPPRSGKTLMAARAIDILNKRVLYVAPSLAIVTQTYNVMCEIFGEGLVARVDGTVTAAQRDVSKQIVIATVNSAVKLPREFFDTRDMLLIDEFHHGAAESYHVINDKASNIFYRLCFTGTHFRTADDRLAMEALCSEVLYRIPVDYLVAGKWLAPPRCVYVRSQAPRLPYGLPYDEVVDRGIVNNDWRNHIISHIAQSMTNSNISSIVLVRRRGHADLLGEMIPDSQVVKGGENALTNDKIQAFREGHYPVLIGTTVIGEGVDLPIAGAVVYGSGGGGSVQQIQSYFRGLTGREGKDQGLIYDVNDVHHATLARHSEARALLAQKCLGNCVVRL